MGITGANAAACCPERKMDKMPDERRIVNIVIALLVCAGLFSAAPFMVCAQNATEYTKQFDFYVDSADKAGLIPGFKGNLDEIMSEGDFLDFIFQFLKVKCGVNVDSVLKRTRASAASEERAKAAAINELLGEDIWKISKDGGLDDKITLDVVLEIFQRSAHKYIAPFSPLIYHMNDHDPVERYNFQNDPTVVYHEDVILSLISEIILLSRGRQQTVSTVEYHVTRRQFAAFCYMFSTMSLPRDISGKYPGGVSGDKRTDDFVTSILDKIIKPDMTDNQKVKAVYDYMIYNFEHDSRSIPIISRGNRNSANPLSSTMNWAMPIIVSGKGTCDAFANALRLLAIRLGFESNFVSGQYLNRDGSKHGHGWNQIKVDDEWYWLDVDVEGTVFRREKGSKPSYFLFMKKDKDWISNHQWNRSDWPAADGTKHKVSLSRCGEPEPITVLPNATSISDSVDADEKNSSLPSKIETDIEKEIPFNVGIQPENQRGIRGFLGYRGIQTINRDISNGVIIESQTALRQFFDEEPGLIKRQNLSLHRFARYNAAYFKEGALILIAPTAPTYIININVENIRLLGHTIIVNVNYIYTSGVFLPEESFSVIRNQFFFALEVKKSDIAGAVNVEIVDERGSPNKVVSNSKVGNKADSPEANNPLREPSAQMPVVTEKDQVYYNSPSPTEGSSNLSGQRRDVPDENSIKQDEGQNRFITFTIPDKKGFVSVGDISLQLAKTDVSKKQCDIRILADGNTIEKKDVKINEPLQIFVGSGRALHEVSINWVRNDSAGGYMRIR